MDAVTPDALRELAHMIETGVDIVAMGERLDSRNADPRAETKLLRERVEAAHIRGEHLQWIGQQLYLIGKLLQSEEEAAVEAFQQPVGDQIDLDYMDGRQEQVVVPLRSKR